MSEAHCKSQEGKEGKEGKGGGGKEIYDIGYFPSDYSSEVFEMRYTSTSLLVSGFTPHFPLKGGP